MKTLLARWTTTLALVFATAGLVAACTTSQAASVQTVTVVARDVSYAPAAVALRANVPVRLTLVNEGVLEHDVTAPDLSVGEAVAPSHGTGEHAMVPMSSGTVHVVAPGGGSATVEFTPRRGSFEFYCAVPGHREAGMRGTVRVM